MGGSDFPRQIGLYDTMLSDADAAIDSWWTAFAATAPEIGRVFTGQSNLDLAEWMHEHLGAVHPELMWEYGPALQKSGHRLVITPESCGYLRPLVWELLARAPEIPGWEFYEYRPAESLEVAEATVQVRAGGTLDGVAVIVRPGEHNLLDLLYVVPPDWDTEQAKKVAFVATECLAGEEALDRWIGGIDSTPRPEGDVRPVPLSELRPRVEQHIESVRESLPAKPWYAVDLDAAAWSSFQGEPDPAEDYEGQTDLFVGITPAPAILQNTLSPWSFDSARHSRFGETFCYLKIDGSEGLSACEFSGREQIEEAINETLRPLALGTSIGGGTGLRYSYVELAVADVAEAWQALRARLVEARLPNRTWLLFHDAYLAAQSYGLYHDTPEPFRRPQP